ncbi:uncharacterized protein LOC125927459 [Panthera uncia]|uniref:uncharacterized protein LOC125927459 n=1 Tax=Panthera uncia TaxID=29064 RepID=UPI0020FF92A6|nr:uncharacterized protein LOC125927459 [Panthera uncia]XP_049493805.1 uncharacterized protein LOC125927459 [Panthera uncia]
MTGKRAPRPLPLPRPPPHRPRPRLPAPGRERAAGRPDPPKGPEAGGARVPRPWGRTPQPHAGSKCKALTWPREERGRPRSPSPGGSAALARAPAWPPTPLSAEAPPGAPALRRELEREAGGRASREARAAEVLERNPGGGSRFETLGIGRTKQCALDGTESQAHTGSAQDLDLDESLLIGFPATREAK